MTGTSLRRCLVFFLLLAVTAAGCSGQERKRFEESLDHSIEANEISVGLPDLQRSSPKEVKEKEKRMLRHIEQSLQAAEGVSIDFLRNLHPDLSAHYQDQFMKGQRLYMEGIKSDDPMKQLQGNTLVMEWSKFWVANQEHILKKLNKS